MLRLVLLLLVQALALIEPRQAAADPERRLPCADYAEVRRQLGTRYGEAPVSMGLQADGRLVQVFASLQSGSWTIVTTAPSGLACIVAAGRSWESLPAKTGDPTA
jgi:hypothetical protein